MSEKLEVIAQEIIGHADGSYEIDYPDEYQELSLEEHAKVDDMVFAEIGNCDMCGWYFNYENLETVHGHGELCWACASNIYEEGDTENED